MRTRQAIGLVAALFLAGCAGYDPADRDRESASPPPPRSSRSTRRRGRSRCATTPTARPSPSPPGPRSATCRSSPPATRCRSTTTRRSPSPWPSRPTPASPPPRWWRPGRRRAQLPGGVALATTSLVVTLINYDRDSGLATFRTPDGLTRRAVVPPELRSFAEALGAGARVLVTMTEALAVTITESRA